VLALALAAPCGREEVPTSVGPRPGIHDHTPHHGGVVTMVGMQHLEAVAADGRFRVYLSDVWRRPLPLDGVSGSVTLAGGGPVLSLVPQGDALETALPPDAPSELRAHVRIARADGVLEANYVLPLGAGALGAAGVPPEGCVPPARTSDPGVRRPRCTIAFGKPVTFVAATPGGDTALVAIAGVGISAWTMPDMRFARGFEPAPPIAAPADAAPHADAANALALSPGGDETVVAIENRLLVHTTASGRLARELPSLHGAIRSVAWARDRLLVSLFYDRAAHLVAASDGRELRRLEVEREGAGVALSPDAKRAAVGSELGAIAIYDVMSDAPPRLLVDSQRAAVALGFVGDRLVSASSDGIVRTWDPGTGGLESRANAAVGLTRLAVAPGGRVVASAGLDHTIRLHEVATGALREALPWHRAAVWGLAWCGTTLVSGDGYGEVAVWDLGD